MEAGWVKKERERKRRGAAARRAPGPRTSMDGEAAHSNVMAQDRQASIVGRIYVRAVYRQCSVPASRPSISY